jgi:hypothetical protein
LSRTAANCVGRWMGCVPVPAAWPRRSAGNCILSADSAGVAISDRRSDTLVAGTGRRQRRLSSSSRRRGAVCRADTDGVRGWGVNPIAIQWIILHFCSRIAGGARARRMLPPPRPVRCLLCRPPTGFPFSFVRRSAAKAAAPIPPASPATQAPACLCSSAARPRFRRPAPVAHLR